MLNILSRLKTLLLKTEEHGDEKPLPVHIILGETHGKLLELSLAESSPERRNEVTFLLEFMLSELSKTDTDFSIEPKNLAHEFILAMIDERENDAIKLEHAVFHLVTGAGPSEAEILRIMMFMVAPIRANEIGECRDIID